MKEKNLPLKAPAPAHITSSSKVIMPVGYATCLHRALSAAEYAIQEGERHADTLRSLMLSIIGNTEMAQVDYVSVADAQIQAQVTVTQVPQVTVTKALQKVTVTQVPQVTVTKALRR